MSRKNNGSGQADTLGIEHIDGLYGYAMVLTRNRTDAEDLVQETYLRALAAMAKLRADSNIQGWLFYYPEKCMAKPVETMAESSSSS